MKKQEKEPQIELKSEEFQEVLSAVPSWILRWGITMVAIITIASLAGSALFKYPDTISATMKLTERQPAATIIAKSSGKIQRIYVKDNQYVSQGTYLALIENSAEAGDVLYIKGFLEKQKPWEEEMPELPVRNITLGNFQSIFASYYTALAEYIQFRKIKYYKEKVIMMRERIVQNEHYYKDLSQQKTLVKKQVDISYKQYRRDSILHFRGVLSEQDLENTYNQYLQAQLTYQNTYTNLENQHIQLSQMHENLYDTEYQYADKQKELELQLKSLTMQLLSEIQNWEMTYVLKAPISGKISFTNYWAENQNITLGDKAFSIVPTKSSTLLGKALLPISRSGKVKIGQKVNIKFSNFPNAEFGSVIGIVRNISLVSVEESKESNYIVEIGLPYGMHTAYHKKLPYIPDMEGQADIITDNISLLERLIMPIKKIFSENL